MEQPLLSRSEAVKKPPSVRTRRGLLSLTRLWWLWVDKAGIEVEDGCSLEIRTEETSALPSRHSWFWSAEREMVA